MFQIFAYLVVRCSADALTQQCSSVFSNCYSQGIVNQPPVGLIVITPETYKSALGKKARETISLCFQRGDRVLTPGLRRAVLPCLPQPAQSRNFQSGNVYGILRAGVLISSNPDLS